jgi:hypothetical protein
MTGTVKTEIQSVISPDSKRGIIYMSFKLKKFTASLTAFVLSAGIMSFTVSADENTAANENAAAENSAAANGGSDSGSEKEFFFVDHFDDGNHSWTGRGGAKLALSDEKPFDGINCLYVSGRTAAWNGAQKELDLTLFEPGKTYSFSCNAMQTAGGAEETFYMKLQYTDAAGQTNYDGIAEATTMKGEWVQLANAEYTIPADATAAYLYVETADGTFDFYVDNAFGAGEATQIAGPKQKKLMYGDINYDGAINIPDLCLIKSAITDGLKDEAQKKAADVNRDKAIDATDAMLIFQWLNAEIEEFPQPPKPDNEWDDYQETASAEWIDFYKSSICSMGNTARLAAKLDAASQGEDLTLAYLGGSITEGKNYSSPFSQYIKDNFCKGKFTEVNAGLSGTSSVVGLVRSEKDICSKNPDIVVIEFSVNDHPDIMYKKCFEACIKKFLSLPNDPAVITLITTSKGGYNSQEQMLASSKNFDIPVISMHDALQGAFKKGFLKQSDYFTDEYHPHKSGGQLVADCMAYYVRQAMRTENRSESYTIPSTSKYGSEYYTCINADPEKDLQNFNGGSFKRGNGYNSLPYSYTSSGGAPMTFKANGKGLIIVFKANSSGMGSVNVTVNGKTTKVNGNKQYTWGGPDAELGYYQDTAGELNVSISASGNFTIWGLGLVK